jgi:hypothetical protein
MKPFFIFNPFIPKPPDLANMVRSKYKKACPQWYVRTGFFRSYGKFNPTFINPV